jgi:hypothetical protein
MTHAVEGYTNTSIIRNSLLGKSAILICLMATASPVPQLNALYTDPKAPLPKHSPRRCKKVVLATYIRSRCMAAYVVFESRIRHSLLSRSAAIFPWCVRCPLRPRIPYWYLRLAVRKSLSGRRWVGDHDHRLRRQHFVGARCRREEAEHTGRLKVSFQTRQFALVTSRLVVSSLRIDRLSGVIQGYVYDDPGFREHASCVEQ